MALGPPPGAPLRRLGSYELVQWLATGGMAEVYVARRLGAYGFTKSVALKRILPQFAKDAEFVAMFIDEARVCARLSHPNLVEVFDFGEDQGDLFMAMELVDGTTCAKLVRAAAARGETVPVEDVLHVVLNVVRGLEYAHSAVDDAGRALNLVHRDVSPGNVLISRTGAVKLGDFGIVRAADLDRRTEQGQLKGKLGYMSPEQVMGKEVDARSDIFTLGIVLAELLTGRPLFSHGAELEILFRIRDADTSVFSRNAGALPEELRGLVYRALARDPADRFQTAAAFAEAIELVVRRRRMTIGATRLSAYLEYIGLVRPATRSGEFRAVVPVATPSPTSPETVPPRVWPSTAPPEPLAGEAGEAGEPTARPATYRLIMADRSVTPPLPLTYVLELIVSGKANADSPVSRDGGAFTAAREHAELKRVSSSSAHRWDFDIDARTAQRFSIDRFSLPFHLFGLAARRETGLLLATQGSRRKKVYMVDGLIEYASSTDREELLGERLLREGLILPVELDMGLAMSPRFGGRLGESLVGLGILKPIEVFRALLAQMRSRVTDLLRWREGDMLFMRGQRSHEETLPQPVCAFELITRGVIDAYGEGELDEMFLPLLDEVPRPGARAAPTPLLLRTSDPVTRAMLLADGKPTIDDLLRELPASASIARHDVLRAVFLGLSCGALTMLPWPPAPERVAIDNSPTDPNIRPPLA
jgi:eukaryotic-like serine/threonine-protein kinase